MLVDGAYYTYFSDRSHAGGGRIGRLFLKQPDLKISFLPTVSRQSMVDWGVRASRLILWREPAVLQAPVLNGFLFDPFPSCDDDCGFAEVSIDQPTRCPGSHASTENL